MEEKIVKIDQLLAKMRVSGDDVMIIAASRSLLKEVYEEMQKNGKQENRRPD